ncbi:MAG: type II secretion system F family protein [Candidatus Microsaccharimonas sossegonensis]|uniref:Type II secretion system F family protein n=1 Tax=Candidatus Microsaccharimonas sossegonensis TaxID=2506948 RepID=A0A4V1J7F0_9BACT|nr:MAG: type II secretion system F family protein [Candidatus Microsaccharimonas sossegonensis]
MKKFAYEARDRATNKLVKASLQAESEHAAAQLLVKQGFVPLSIKEQIGDGSFLARITGRITTKDRVVFTRQLATLIGAGLPLSQSLHTVLEQTSNKQLQSVIQEIVADVEGGKSLSLAFGKHPTVFDGVFISLVSAGELSGTLDDSLQRVAAQQEKDAATMSKIKGALTYPIIVLVVIFGVLAFMLFTVVPQVEKLYTDLRKELPFLTKIMVAAADGLARYWWIVLIAVGIGVYFLLQFLKTEAGIRFKDEFKLRIPVFGKMVRKLYMARFTRTGQTLLGTGVSMLDMLKVSSTAVNNTVIAKAIDRAADKVKGGKALSAALEPEEMIMTLVPQMIKIGEQSGRIDEMLGKVAQVYEDELDEQIKTISTAIEPILMVVLAVVAGGMVGAILLPIYGLVNGVNV